eukprot:3352389-Amphidinium_carterae.1
MADDASEAASCELPSMLAQILSLEARLRTEGSELSKADVAARSLVKPAEVDVVEAPGDVAVGLAAVAPSVTMEVHVCAV